MSVHNGQRYLREAVESILRQTCSDFEFLIVDDGSVDRTPEILARYARKDTRIRIFRQENAGLASALNRAVSVAQGEFLARMDADDRSTKDRLELQIPILEQQKELVGLGSCAFYIDEFGMRFGKWNVPGNYEDIRERHLEGYPGQIIHPSFVFRREPFLRIGGYSAEYIYAQDYELWLRLAEVGEIANLRNPLLEYRLHPGSFSLAKTEAQRQAVEAACSRHRKRLGLPACRRHLSRHHFIKDDWWISKNARRNGCLLVACIHLTLWLWRRFLNARNYGREGLTDQ